eukprot:scaffold30101_cov73-Phaeocystis_antarctica.AAC.3
MIFRDSCPSSFVPLCCIAAFSAAATCFVRFDTAASAASSFCRSSSACLSNEAPSFKVTKPSHSNHPPDTDSLTTIASMWARVSARYMRERVSSMSSAPSVSGASRPTAMTINRSRPSKAASVSRTISSLPCAVRWPPISTAAASAAVVSLKLREASPEPKVERITSSCSSSCGRKPSQNELSGTRIATRSCSLRPGKSRMIWSRASTIFSEYSWKRFALSAPGGRSKRNDLSGGPSDSW